VDNVFITQYFDWNPPESRKSRVVNALLQRLGVGARLVSPGHTGALTNVEQRINMFHLVMQVLVGGVEGDLVEFGTFRGSSAVLIQKVIELFAPGRRLHVYDTFAEAAADELHKTFAGLGLAPPVVHAGDLTETLPARLPERVCFAHIDLAPGDSPDAHAWSLRHGLAALYPRLAPGAVCLLADYCDPSAYDRPGFTLPRDIVPAGPWNQCPHVKQAADEFLRDKPEKVFYLYSGNYSHGFFRRADR
jgi:O-methyltransferase